MTTVSTLSTNSTTYTYEEMLTAIANGTLDEDDVTDISVFSASTDSSECTDGEDDGKIGILSAAANIVKGAGSGLLNGVKGMFFDEDGNFSLARTAKTALTTAACFIPGVGPIFAAGLCTYGAISGAATVVQGVAAAASAETDAEAKAAFQSIGSGTLTTGLSLWGLKSSVSQIASNAGVENVASNSTLQNLKGIGKNISENASTASGITGKISSGFNTLTGNYYSSAWSASTAESTVGKVADVAKQTVKDTGSNIIKAAETVKNKAKDTVDKVTGKKGSTTDINALSKKFSKEYGEINGKGSYPSADGSTTLEVKEVANANGGTTYEYSITKNTGTATTIEKTSTKVEGKTEGSFEDLQSQYDAETVQNAVSEAETKLSNGDSSYTLQKGESFEFTTESGSTVKATKTGTNSYSYTETSNYTSTNTSTSTLDSVKNTKITTIDGVETTVGDALSGTNTTVETAKGVTYTLNSDGTVTAVSTSSSSKLAYDLSNYVTSSVEGSYNGLASSGNVKTALLAALSLSSADASSDIADSISDASTTYATVTTETGVEYELEDYSIMSEDELDESYASILSSVL